ncbi:DUF1802 family protein [Alienimonas chondri]|uniref:DUF1802 family protein n=1 Tax=Alienimonas chondri TaxID=2681879 RepID=A0ABX1V6Z5_9PLAN|nr:DUF1802 family protein [Alienimonas chondri]NNJ24042.1 hypothetical protein [Alienimonas chondri]
MNDSTDERPSGAADDCRVAFKEWAAVCDALCEGRVDLILRKGGIHERRGEFRPEHDRFWLMATRFHQDAADLAPFLHDRLPEPPPEGVVRLPGWCQVMRTWQVTDEADLEALRGRHALSDATAIDRFRYKEPGLWAIAVKVWTPGAPIELPDSPSFGGCRSWVDLPAVSTAGLRAVQTHVPR